MQKLANYDWKTCRDFGNDGDKLEPDLLGNIVKDLYKVWRGMKHYKGDDLIFLVGFCLALKCIMSEGYWLYTQTSWSSAVPG